MDVCLLPGGLSSCVNIPLGAYKSPTILLLPLPLSPSLPTIAQGPMATSNLIWIHGALRVEGPHRARRRRYSYVTTVAPFVFYRLLYLQSCLSCNFISANPKCFNFF